MTIDELETKYESNLVNCFDFSPPVVLEMRLLQVLSSPGLNELHVNIIAEALA